MYVSSRFLLTFGRKCVLCTCVYIEIMYLKHWFLECRKKIFIFMEIYWVNILLLNSSMVMFEVVLILVV